MALKTGSPSPFTLIDKKMDLEDLVEERLMDCNRFALDCEPSGLSRTNPIRLIKIGLVNGLNYFVDLQKVGGLSGGLEKILSNPNVRKFMLDCRGFAGSLKYQYGVKLEGIVDIQIMGYVLENQNLSAARRLPGFSHLIFKYLGGQKSQQYDSLKVDESSQWVNHPVREDFLEYASFKISCFFPLRDKLMESLFHTEDEVAEWSVKYAASHMENALFDQSDPYKSQSCVMPFNVLIESPLCSIRCAFCGNRLPDSEFGLKALQKGKQKCIICKEVMLVMKRQKDKEGKKLKKIEKATDNVGHNDII